MIGQNEVYLTGFLKFPELKQTRNGHVQFKGKVAVPVVFKDKTGEQREITKYVKISAWAQIAEELGNLPDGTPIRVQGSFNDRAYDGNCKHCGTVEKKYWTDVAVDNFEVVDDR